jgi:putative oxidoreductase
MAFPVRKTAHWILRLGFAVLLGWASVDKILHPYPFARDVLNYRVVNEGLSYLTAVWLPYLELFTAVCLLTGFWLEAAVVLNAILMWTFLGLVLQAFLRRLDIHCGCFTVKGDSVIGPLKIAENTVFALLGLVLAGLVLKTGKRESAGRSTTT